MKETFRTVIKDLGDSAEGITKLGKMTVFVEGVTLGDEVEIRLKEVKKNYAIGEVIRVITPSPFRVEIPCPHYPICGGCQTLELDYEKELELKTDHVKNALSRIGGLDIEVQPIIGMTNPWHYRNKMSYPVKDSDIGLYEKDSHTLVPIHTCSVHDPKVDEILRVIRRHLQGEITSYDEKQHKGMLRQVMVRVNKDKTERMVVLVCSDKGPLLPLVEDLINQGTVTTVIHNENFKPGNRILGDKSSVLYGNGLITDQIEFNEFRISEHSFFQVNSEQTPVLYEIVRSFAALTGHEVVFDLYSGMGTIGSHLARNAKEVYCIEVVKQAVEDGIRSATENGLSNLHFLKGASEKILPELIQSGVKADLIVVDPPRKGLEPQLVQTILASGVKRVVYVSCKPSTLARDLKLFSEGGFRVEKVQPVDMFPHTMHVETCVLMSKVD